MKTDDGVDPKLKLLFEFCVIMGLARGFTCLCNSNKHHITCKLSMIEFHDKVLTMLTKIGRANEEV